MKGVFKQLVFRSSIGSGEINLKKGSVLLAKAKRGSIFAAAKQERQTAWNGKAKSSLNGCVKGN